MNRKEFLQTKTEDPNWSKTLRRLKRNGVYLPPYPLMTMAQKYKYNDIHKIGYLDIETSSLQADFGFMLSYAILVRDISTRKTELRYDVVNKKDFEYAEKKKDADLKDERILNNLIEDMADLDCQIGHWFIGKRRHDIPFIRSRCAINKISGFPKHRTVRYGDTQKWSAQIHRLRSNSLSSIADAYDLSIHKTPISSKSWKNASSFATKKDLDYILDHNIKDCKITYQVHKHLEDYVPIPSVYA